jgi:Tfp pilus assembly protein PilN
VIFYGALFFQEQNVRKQHEIREQSISGLEEQILDFEELNQEISELGDQIVVVNDALNQHIYWTRFFELLEKYTVAEVTYGGLSAGTGGALTLSARGDDYESVARQLTVLQSEQAKEFVQSVDISNASLIENQGVGFDIILVLNPSLFYYEAEE